MKKLLIEKLLRITKNKKRLQEKLGVEIRNRGKEIYINGKPENEFIAEKVIEALDFGFPFSKAIAIKTEEFEFQIINIKDHTRKKDLSRIRARIIGTKGKTLQTLSNLTECGFELKDNQVGIVGDPELIKNAQEAITLIIQGSKQGNVYSYLEKHQVKPVEDLGLRE